MNNTNNDGGPAFPTLRENDNPAMPLIMASSGMTLRDWFAGQASEEDVEAHLGGKIHPQTGRTYATLSREEAKYAYADAMLKAREVHV